MVKYCIANLYVNCLGECDVSYYAYKKDQYGLYKVANWDDPYVLWCETEAEAKGFIWNSNDCIISRYFEAHL